MQDQLEYHTVEEDSTFWKGRRAETEPTTNVDSGLGRLAGSIYPRNDMKDVFEKGFRKVLAASERWVHQDLLLY